MAGRVALIAVTLFIVTLTLATRVVAGEALSQQKKMERIAISKLKKKLDSGEQFLLIDVRKDWELEKEGAIPGAIHISMTELDKRMKNIPKNVELVFY